MEIRLKRKDVRDTMSLNQIFRGLPFIKMDGVDSTTLAHLHMNILPKSEQEESADYQRYSKLLERGERREGEKYQGKGIACECISKSLQLVLLCFWYELDKPN